MQQLAGRGAPTAAVAAVVAMVAIVTMSREVTTCISPAAQATISS